MCPLAGMLGNAGAKEMNRVKPQRSRRVRVLDVDVDVGSEGAEAEMNIGIWVSDICGSH
jgi:hypothetical protein